MQWLNLQTEIPGKWPLSCSGSGEIARCGGLVATSQRGRRREVDLRIVYGILALFKKTNFATVLRDGLLWYLIRRLAEWLADCNVPS